MSAVSLVGVEQVQRPWGSNRRPVGAGLSLTHIQKSLPMAWLPPAQHLNFEVGVSSGGK